MWQEAIYTVSAKAVHLCLHPPIVLFIVLSTLNQCGHTQESVCCLHSSFMRYNHFKSYMLLLLFQAEPPAPHNCVTRFLLLYVSEKMCCDDPCVYYCLNDSNYSLNIQTSAEF